MPGPSDQTQNQAVPHPGASKRLRDLLQYLVFTLKTLLVGGGLFLSVFYLAMSPVEDESPLVWIDPESLKQNKDKSILAQGIPQNKIPDYSLNQFNYVATQKGKRQWNLHADQAFVYNQEKLVHTRLQKVQLFDQNGKPTVVLSQEGKFSMTTREIEFYGNVQILLPDGFEIRSEYLHYSPSKYLLSIPSAGDTPKTRGFEVAGFSAGAPRPQLDSAVPLFSPRPVPDASPTPSASASPDATSSPHPLHSVSPSSSPQRASPQRNQHLFFRSIGLRARLDQEMVTLPQAARVWMIRQPQAKNSSQNSLGGVPEETLIESDQAFVYRKSRVARFLMNSQRPAESRFIHLTQPTLFLRARSANLNFGDLDSHLQYIVANDDVLIKEVPQKHGKNPPNRQEPSPRAHSLRYATAGKAEFDTQRDVIQLSRYPQVYLGDDTVTGEVILLHRDSDIVEIEQSNSFSKGEPSE